MIDYLIIKFMSNSNGLITKIRPGITYARNTRIIPIAMKNLPKRVRSQLMKCPSSYFCLT